MQVTVTQERFGYDGAAPERAAVGHPDARARARRSGVGPTERSLLLDGDHATFDAPANALVVLDAGGEGFYRVSYPPEWRDRLLDAGVLSAARTVLARRRPLGRGARRTGPSAPELLALARQLRGEDDLVVWRVLVSVLRGDGSARRRRRPGRACGPRSADVLAPTFARLGWQPAASDDARTRQLRGRRARRARHARRGPGRDRVGARAVPRRAGDPDVVVGLGGDRRRRRRCRHVRRVRDSVRTRRRHRRPSCATCTGSGAFPTEELALRAAQYAMSDAVRPQNGPFLIQRALRNRRPRPRGVGVRARPLGRRCGPVLRLADPEAARRDHVARRRCVARRRSAFLAEHPVPEGTRVIAQHLERQRVHRAVVDRERDRLSAALLDR